MAAWAAVLLLIGTSTTFTEGWGKFKASKGLSLDMAPDSVDDMYRGCEKKMENKIKTQFLNNEINHSGNFKLAWRKAEQYYNTKWKYAATLKKEEIMAIYAYTLETPKLYSEFNEAVRTQKSKYKTTFAYHTLHFYLTSAIKTLNTAKPQAGKCFTSYRRVNREFRISTVNKKFRFGAFTSSSVGHYPSAGFGDKTCFKIYTCFGADISKYSKFESEREALIPPYEVFKVTKTEKRTATKYLPCQVVYHVRSTGTPASNLNCAFTKKKRSCLNCLKGQ